MNRKKENKLETRSLLVIPALLITFFFMAPLLFLAGLEKIYKFFKKLKNK